MRLSKLGLWWGGLFSLLGLAWGDPIWSALGLGLAVAVLADFIKKLGNTLPLLELIFMVSVFQLILGPYFSYRLPRPYFRYVMHIPELEYMPLSVSAHLLFLLGLSMFRFPLNLVLLKTKVAQLTLKYPRIGIHLIIAGLVASYLQTIAPAAIRFILYLAANLIYVGGILYFFTQTNRYRWGVYAFSLVFAFIQASRSSLFHDFLLWGVLGISFVFMNLKQTFLQKVSIIGLGLVFIITLQLVKTDYRGTLSQQELSLGDRLRLLGYYANQNLSQEGLFSPEKLSELNVRLNQGWITSAIMAYTPAHEPFANGRTIWLAAKDALLPRILAPNKKGAGGREYFRQYTGIPIDNNTSMGIGLLGEAYLNFSWGAGLFLMAWGLFLGLFFVRILRLSMQKNILIFFMIPIIFLQVIKAETEFHTVLNHLLKSVIFSYFLYVVWFSKYKPAQSH